MIKRSMQEESITFTNTYVSNIGVTKYIKQITEMKGEIDSNTLIIGDFNISLISVNRSYSKKINKETVALNDTLDHLDLIDD